MNCDDIKMMISEYLDNELPKEKDGILFTHLSSCSECREEFKSQNIIQHQVKLHKKQVPDRLEERVFNSIKQRQNQPSQTWLTRPMPVYVNYLLGIVIILIALFSYMQISALRYDLNNFQDRYDTAIERIQIQSQQMNLMMNNMPAVRITSNPAKL
ncbi:MAG: hypothetical protein HF300_14575 [Ignavibacteria bacterium]|jgi:predicted anti-sigma-YlaC factor YlaD|nr:hypothetical protein [Ignavibacteria bacterium]